MARPKKKKETEKTEIPLRRLTRSMSMKLSDLPAVPMDKIMDALRNSCNCRALANLRKTSKFWKCAVDDFLARRPPMPINSLVLGNGLRRTVGYTVRFTLDEDTIPLNQFAGLRKTGVKRRSWTGIDETTAYGMDIRVRDGRDPIINQLSTLMGNIQWMNIRLAANTDMSPVYRLLSKTRVENLDCSETMQRSPHQYGNSVQIMFSTQFIIDLVRNVRISHVKIRGGNLDKFLHDLDANVDTVSLYDFEMWQSGSGVVLGLGYAFWHRFLADKLPQGTVWVNGDQLTKSDNIDLTHFHSIFSIGWTNK